MSEILQFSDIKNSKIFRNKKYENSEILKYENLKILKFENLEIQNAQKINCKNFKCKE